MVQKTFTDADLSAYTDGRLAPAKQAVLETALAQDPELRRQADRMRQIKAMLRDLPLQEPPRNYLLTPSMVQSDVKSAPSRRSPLPVMRWATALTTAAFAVTLGLNLLVRVPAPMMLTTQLESEATYASEAAPQAALKANDTVTAEKAFIDEAPAGLAEDVVREEAGEEARSLAAPVTVPEDPAVANSEGVGASVAKESESVTITTLSEAEELPAPSAENAPSAEIGVSEAAPAEMPMLDQTQGLGYATAIEASTRPLLPLGVPVTLGILALVALGVTIWLSRRR